jgi:hypothetical protein
MSWGEPVHWEAFYDNEQYRLQESRTDVQDPLALNEIPQQWRRTSCMTSSEDRESLERMAVPTQEGKFMTLAAYLQMLAKQLVPRQLISASPFGSFSC